MARDSAEPSSGPFWKARSVRTERSRNFARTPACRNREREPRRWRGIQRFDRPWRGPPCGSNRATMSPGERRGYVLGSSTVDSLYAAYNTPTRKTNARNPRTGRIRGACPAIPPCMGGPTHPMPIIMSNIIRNGSDTMRRPKTSTKRRGESDPAALLEGFAV